MSDVRELELRLASHPRFTWLRKMGVRFDGDEMTYSLSKMDALAAEVAHASGCNSDDRNEIASSIYRLRSWMNRYGFRDHEVIRMRHARPSLYCDYVTRFMASQLTAEVDIYNPVELAETWLAEMAAA